MLLLSFCAALPALGDADVAITLAAPFQFTSDSIPFPIEVTVTNLGPDAASGVVVTDSFPTTLTVLSSTCGAAPGPPWKWSVGSLTAGEVRRCNVTVSMSSCSPIDNSAVVTTGTTDPNAANDRATLSNASELVQDGSFEAGIASSAWTQTSTIFGTVVTPMQTCSVILGAPHSGVFAVWFGGSGAYVDAPRALYPVDDSSITQNVTIPPGAGPLEFWTMAQSCTRGASFKVQVDGTTVFDSCVPAGEYSRQSIDVSPFADGGVHGLTFLWQVGGGQAPATLWVDDVSLRAGTCTQPPSISIGDDSRTEGTGGTTTLEFPLSLSKASPNAVTVQWSTVPGSADATDFTPASGTVTFPAETTTAIIPVTIATDSLRENVETFTVRLSTPQFAAIAEDEATGTIVDDDKIAGLTMAVTAPGVAEVGVPIAIAVAIQNAGPDAATKPVVTWVVPSELSVSTVSASQGTCTGTSTVVCTLGALASDGSATIALQVASAVPGSVVSSFTLTNPESDPTPVGSVAATTTFVRTEYSAPSATGSGTIQVKLTGAGPLCTLSTPRFIPLTGDRASPPSGSAPSNIGFPHGLFDFRVTGCTPGSAVTLEITYPATLTAGTVYWKYGPRPGPLPASWYVLPSVIAGNKVTFTIIDGQLGDDDLLANGSVVDQGGPGVPGEAIPTLSPLALLLIAATLAGIGWMAAFRL